LLSFTYYTAKRLRKYGKKLHKNDKISSLYQHCMCAETQLMVRRGSDSALCRAVSDTSSECSTDATVVSALQKFQLTSFGKNVQAHALSAHHPANHPVCLPHRIHCVMHLQ